MASGTDTARPEAGERRSAAAAVEKTTRRPRRREARPRGWPLGSKLGQLIIVLNLLGLAVLIGGVLILNELRQGLVQTRLDSLELQGELIANVIDQTATVGDPTPALQPDIAEGVLGSLFIPRSQRARLYDAQGKLLADSDLVADRVEANLLPPARKPGEGPGVGGDAASRRARRDTRARAALDREVASALQGQKVSDVRPDENGRRVVSVSIPIQHVRVVLGVLTLEAGDVESVIAAQRRALIPFILIAIGVALISSLLLTQLIAVPVLRLARAADRVRLSRARAIELPDLARRDDELGDLTRSLEAMTQALSDRMTAIERFAADVAHELRNPMTSIRSAVETLEIVKADAPRQRLMGILQQDVSRLDRLITDISNASRLDAEMARDAPASLDVGRLLADICGFYDATVREGEAHVAYQGPPAGERMLILGREGPLSQVFRNLIDNARSFSPPRGAVRVSLRRDGGEARICIDDDGPGIPPENIETVFERFYTARPKGAAFGGNSGLGLAIARQIVETHSGRIWAENRMRDGEVHGARFVVSLPLSQTAGR
ncbi:MAG TPA: stimulus-sensing domain-containing protein [Caulobacteraceae bacterium]|jgi:two-component system sensor histidine kinase ChvG|nr:stimulus-sensing domain-containing protein [Caulobacteraceae bacterium]